MKQRQCTCKSLIHMRVPGVAFHPHSGIMVTSNREREKENAKARPDRSY